MPEFQYDRKRFVEPVSISGLERATRRNAYDIDNKATQTPTTTEPTTPTTPIGPGGTLVTPPVIAGPNGYPIPRDIPGEDISGNAWLLLDGRPFGWFERTLLTRVGTSANTSAINLDNTNQRLSYASSIPGSNSGMPLSIRDGQLWDGAFYWNGSSWVRPTTFAVTHLDGTPGTITGTALSSDLTGSWGGAYQRDGYSYFVTDVTFASGTTKRLCRVAHGTMQIQCISPSLTNISNTGTTALGLFGIEGGYAWFMARITAGNTYAALVAMEMGTQTVKAFGTSPNSNGSVYHLYGYPVYLTLSGTGVSESPSFVLADGRLAFLSRTTGETHHALHILRFNGALTVQANYFPVNNINTAAVPNFYLPVPGGSAKLIPTPTAGVWANLTPQGWQEVTFPIVNGTLANSFNQTSVRWKDQEWGTTLQWTTTRDLYEGSITS